MFADKNLQRFWSRRQRLDTLPCSPAQGGYEIRICNFRQIKNLQTPRWNYPLMNKGLKLAALNGQADAPLRWELPPDE